MPRIRSLILVMGAVLPAQALCLEDPRQLWSQYDKNFQVAFGPQWKDIPLSDRISFLDAQLRSSGHSASERYLLQRTLLTELRFEGERVRARDLCLAMPVPEDDYEVRAACILSRVSSPDEQRQALENLFSLVVREKAGTIFPAAVAGKLLDVYWKQNDIAATQSLYNRALDVTPLEAVESLIELKETTAVIFSNPSNSPKVIQKALDIFV